MESRPGRRPGVGGRPDDGRRSAAARRSEIESGPDLRGRTTGGRSARAFSFELPTEKKIDRRAPLHGVIAGERAGIK